MVSAQRANSLEFPKQYDGHLRRAPINPNHWYAIALSSEIGKSPVGRELWNQPMVLFRNSEGKLHALEDRCAHRLVRLSHGTLVGGGIECAYHGWRFDGSGRCTFIPDFAAGSLPNCRVKSFPLQERDGFAWIFPGDPALASETQPMEIPEWDDLNHISSVARFSCRAHFSFVIENLMDMFHGNLHAKYQVFKAKTLKEVLHNPDSVTARYLATTFYRGTDLWSAFQLFFPSLRKSYESPLTVTYQYPHWKAALGTDFKLDCVICPVTEKSTVAYLIHHASLEKFTVLNGAPGGIRRAIKKAMTNIAKPLLRNLARQDIVMIEEEQQSFEQNPERHPFEVNSALHHVQHLIREQAPTN
ncbi:MAG: Rieske 2Fe-2S domain-containing protein [Deltaproteobacteria bacterium]|nr:Rieske 2Fe-2S domain-containing protein [Deltaproteobacteria bacterium]